MPRQKIVNSFEGGLNMDSHVYQTPQGTYTYGKNFTFITHNGNEIILQNEKGTVFSTSLKPGYVCLAGKSYGSVAYIISAQINADGTFTGRGEVGTFPSPDYANKVQDCSTGTCYFVGDMIPVYSPLKNYLSDEKEPTLYSFDDYTDDFNSALFNFNPEYPVKIVAVQPSYDGSVNIIFTDNLNKPKLVNTRFSVLPNDRFRIVDRVGRKDENLYDRDSFKVKLNHILSTEKIVNVSFEGQQSGGRLSCGTYRYYFKYATQDGNTTDVVASTFNIPVFFGDNPGNIIGGIANEPTTRANKLALIGLDTTFSYVKVYFSYLTGEQGSPPVSTIYEIENLYPLTSDTLSLVHTGYENTSEASLAEVAADTANIYTYRTGVEVQGRLFTANIKQKAYDSQIFRDFAAKITTGNVVKEMSVPGFNTDNNHTDIFSDIPFDGTENDLWAGGYYNPRNVHDYLGYWRRETYMFGIVFILTGGGYSPVFPVRGIDESVTSYAHTYPNASLDFYDGANESFQQFLAATGENARGVYRFPKIEFCTGNIVKVLGVTFKVPTLTQEILDASVGAFFVRADRKKDCAGQGMMIDTLPIPISDYLKDGNDRLSEYDFNEAGTKFIPAHNFILESLSRHGIRDNFVRGARLAYEEHQGIDPVMFNPHAMSNWLSGAGDVPAQYWYKKKFAFLSPEIIANKTQSVYQLQGSKYIKLLAKFENLYSFKSLKGVSRDNDSSGDPPYEGHFSVVKTQGIAEEYDQDYEAQTDFVQNNNSVPTANGFASKCEFWGLFNSAYKWKDVGDEGGDYDGESYRMWGNFPLIFNNYLGVETTDQLAEYEPPYDVDSTSALQNPFRKGNFDGAGSGENGIFLDSYDYNNFTNTAVTDERSFLSAVYPQEGIRSIQVNKDIHFPQYESYTPITQPFYWNASSRNASNGSAPTLEELLVNDVVEAFNGDNFISLHYHRMFFNGLGRLIMDGRLVERSIDVGYTMAFLSESNVNTAFKNKEILDINEGERDFVPHYAENQLGTRYGNKWREYRNPESEAYNTGYSNAKSDRAAAGVDTTIPFIQDIFDTRIHASDVYVSNTFNNGYRIFPASLYKDYSRHIGQIVDLQNLNGTLIAIHETGVVQIPLQQRIGGIGDSAGEVFFEAPALLPPLHAVNYLSEKFGTKSFLSVHSSDNTVYAVDIDRAKIWRISGNGIEIISDFKVQSFLRSIQMLFRDKQEHFLKKKIAVYFDKLKADLIFSFVSADEDNESTCGIVNIIVPTIMPTMTLSNDTITISGGVEMYDYDASKICFSTEKSSVVTYNEQPLSLWQFFKGYMPHNMFTIYDRLYSLPFPTDFNLDNFSHIWEHHKGPYSTYYGELQECQIEFVATLGTVYHQVYDNLLILGNHVYPLRIEYTTDVGTFVQTIKPRNIVGTASSPFYQPEVNNTFLFDAVYKEDHMYVTIIKDQSDLRMLTDYINRRIRDKYCKIKIVYLTDSPLFIQAVQTLVNVSFS